MTVLLVDDQISILSGLISGLNWTALGVTAIRTAGSAAQAREILDRERIDVMLCDIEMPGENWLSLLRWVRGRSLDPVCVFLTSHADFLYAKEAISLGCFDYVLQPARYDDIQSTVARAINRVKTLHRDQELKNYGIFAKSNPAALFQNLFSHWLAGNPLQISRLRSILHQLNRELRPGCDCAVVVCQLLRWNAEPWTTEEWVYGLNNILKEVFEASGCNVLFFSIDSTSVGWFLYGEKGRFPTPDSPYRPLMEVYPRIDQYFPCDFAFYLSPSVALEKISKYAAPLLKAKRDNVLMTSGVFPWEQEKTQPRQSVGADSVQLRRWGDLLAAGNGRLLRQELNQYLDSFTSAGNLDYESLRVFWLQFQQVVLNTLWNAHMDDKEILPLLNRGENVRSVPDVRELVRQVTARFEQADLIKDEDALIHQIIKYVDAHLDQPLSVSDVACAMYMNPDYLSRLFKSRHGIPLKEYIVAQKMHAAQVLLQTTSLPVSAIASKLGYDNFSYFSQAYRKVMGVSPTDERKSNG